MKPGDMVRRILPKTGMVGLFMGLRSSGDYVYAEIMWFDKAAPNGDAVSSIQKNLIEVVKEAS